MDKKALLIIAHETFRDEEYLEPRRILEENGIQITVASWDTGIAIGKFGTQVNIDITINEVDTNQYNAIIYIGGAGSKRYWDNPIAHKIAQEAIAEHKVLASICSSTVTLAKAGVLKNKKATCFSGDASELYKEGVFYSEDPVVQDGLIITANGPKAALDFGVRIVKTIEQLG
jgi:protease I